MTLETQKTLENRFIAGFRAFFYFLTVCSRDESATRQAVKRPLFRNANALRQALVRFIFRENNAILTSSLYDANTSPQAVKRLLFATPARSAKSLSAKATRP